MPVPCAACGRPIPEGLRPRTYCQGTSTCRARAFRARQSLRRDLFETLLLRQTEAVISGDTAALTAISAKARQALDR